MDRLEFMVPPAQAGVRLGVFLRRQGVSAGLLRRLKWREDGLCVNGQRAHTDHHLTAGECVSLSLADEDVAPLEPQDIPLDILYENEHFMVVNKPAGLVMHPTRSHKNGTLANGYAALMARRGWRCAFRPVGRLDADTSGLVLCALNAYAAPQLAGSMRKAYLALATGRMRPGSGWVNAPLGPAPGSVIRQCVCPGGAPSRTAYTVLAACDAATLLHVRPRTGRTHQIRAHMAHIGHPLVGDGLYGGSTSLLGRHALHCAELRATLPGAGEELHFSAPLPADMRAVLEALGLPTCQSFGTIV